MGEPPRPPQRYASLPRQHAHMMNMISFTTLFQVVGLGAFVLIRNKNFDFPPELVFVTSQGRPTPYAHDLPDMLFLYHSLALSYGAIVHHSTSIQHPPPRYPVLHSMPFVQPGPDQLDARPADIKGRPTIYPSTYPNILSLSTPPRYHLTLLPVVSVR